MAKGHVFSDSISVKRPEGRSMEKGSRLLVWGWEGRGLVRMGPGGDGHVLKVIGAKAVQLVNV